MYYERYDIIPGAVEIGSTGQKSRCLGCMFLSNGHYDDGCPDGKNYRGNAATFFADLKKAGFKIPYPSKVNGKSLFNEFKGIPNTYYYRVNTFINFKDSGINDSYALFNIKNGYWASINSRIENNGDISPKAIQSIDKKMDDGLYNEGLIRGFCNGTKTNNSGNCSNYGNCTNSYDDAIATGKKCNAMWYWLFGFF
jgi:hypothetical protein